MPREDSGSPSRGSATWRSRSVTRLARWTSEPALARFYSDFRRSGRPAAVFGLRHPLGTLLAVVATLRLPSLEAALSRSPGGDALYEALSRPVRRGVPLGAAGVSVLTVPEDPRRYVEGRARQTLRRRLRSAQRRGVVCRPVDDPEERRKLLQLTHETERSHPDQRYRIPDPDNEDLLRHDLWLATYSRHGEPLLLSVTPVDGEWAMLRYFRTLGHGTAHSDSRYLACVALVEALVERRVRYLVDTWHPGEIPEGLRQFQRSVGYRLVRVVLRRTSGAVTLAEPALVDRGRPRARA